MPNDQASQRSVNSSITNAKSSRTAHTIHSARVTKVYRVQSERSEQDSNDTSIEHNQVEKVNNPIDQSNKTKQNTKKRVKFGESSFNILKIHMLKILVTRNIGKSDKIIT